MRSAPSFRICPPPPSQKIAAQRMDPARLPDPSARERREIGRASGDADRHEHRMAGEEIRAGEDHERKRNAEACAHRQTAQGRLDQLAQSEDQDDADADARHHRRDEKGKRRLARESRLGGRGFSKTVERLCNHVRLLSAKESGVQGAVESPGGRSRHSSRRRWRVRWFLRYRFHSRSPRRSRPAAP